MIEFLGKRFRSKIFSATHLPPFSLCVFGVTARFTGAGNCDAVSWGSGNVSWPRPSSKTGQEAQNTVVMHMNLLSSEEDKNLQAPAPLTVRDVVYYAALLAGVGARASQVSDEAADPLNAFAVDGRTCLDGGSVLMFSLSAPGGRGLRVLTRCGPAAGGILPWLCNHYPPTGPVDRWAAENFVGEPPTAWEHARAVAERAGGLEAFRHVHAILGPFSHLCTVSWSLEGEHPQAWVGWQLDRTLPASEGLAAVGCGQAWPAAAAIWEALLGHPPDPRRGPWSISLLFGGEFRLRLGSTNWARQIEEPEKRRRLATLVERQGGDRRFAEALYKLVESAFRKGRRRAIGRAVEVELAAGKVDSTEFYICMP